MLPALPPIIQVWHSLLSLFRIRENSRSRHFTLISIILSFECGYDPFLSFVVRFVMFRDIEQDLFLKYITNVNTQKELEYFIFILFFDLLYFNHNKFTYEKFVVVNISLIILMLYCKHFRISTYCISESKCRSFQTIGWFPFNWAVCLLRSPIM